MSADRADGSDGPGRKRHGSTKSHANVTSKLSSSSSSPSSSSSKTRRSSVSENDVSQSSRGKSIKGSDSSKNASSSEVIQKEARAVFKKWDVDGSGHIDSKELKTAIKVLGYNTSSDDINELIMDFDSNGDGQISFNEFLDIQNAMRANGSEGLHGKMFQAMSTVFSGGGGAHGRYRHKCLTDSQIDDYKRMFMEMDADDSMSLELNEILKLLKNNGFEDVSPAMARKLFSEMDNDGSRSIEMNEFLEFMANLQRLKHKGGIFGDFISAASSQVPVFEQYDNSLENNKSNSRGPSTRRSQSENNVADRRSGRRDSARGSKAGDKDSDKTPKSLSGALKLRVGKAMKFDVNNCSIDRVAHGGCLAIIRPKKGFMSTERQIIVDLKLATDIFLTEDSKHNVTGTMLDTNNTNRIGDLKRFGFFYEGDLHEFEADSEAEAANWVKTLNKFRTYQIKGMGTRI